MKKISKKTMGTISKYPFVNTVKEYFDTEHSDTSYEEMFDVLYGKYTELDSTDLNLNMNNLIVLNNAMKNHEDFEKEESIDKIEYRFGGIVSIVLKDTLVNFKGYSFVAERSMSLFINNCLMASKYFKNTEDRDNEVKKLQDLFSLNPDGSHYTKVQSLYDVFNKPANSDTNKMFSTMQACAVQLHEAKDDEGADYRNSICKWNDFIIGKYIEYLSEKADTDPQYILSFINFIKDNKRSWLENDTDEISVVLFSDDHKILVDSFLKEKDILYINNKVDKKFIIFLCAVQDYL